MHPSDELVATYRLFASIRDRFSHPGVERGGCLRPGVTPVYVRTFGPHAASLFPNLTTVEASFTPEQFSAIMHTTLLLKGWISGAHGQPNLTTRILEQFNHTRPSFARTLLHSTEQLLAACIATHPAQAPVFDALFRVAGAEGFRDLIQLHGTRLLHQTPHQEQAGIPDILGFVHLHQRPSVTGSFTEPGEQYEVWCPGYDLAKVFYQQCQAAASYLREHETFAHIPTREMELHSLPIDMVRHLTTFVHQNVREVLTRHGITE